MRRQFTRRIMVALAILLAFGVCFSEATNAQRRRTKRSRRATNPVVTERVTMPATVPSTEPQIISTADQQASEQSNASEVSGQVPSSPRRSNRKRAAAVSEPESEEDSMRRTVNDLSTTVNKLSDKLTQMEEQQRTLVDMERLSRAEQRAEVLRTQQRDVVEKEGILQARLEQIDFDLKPENVDRSVSTFGSTHPEEARDARRRSLESEKVRVRSQLDLFATSRQRLETAIVNADLEVDKLRRRIEEATEPQPKTATTDSINNTNDTEGIPTTTPTGTSPNSSTPPR